MAAAGPSGYVQNVGKLNYIIELELLVRNSYGVIDRLAYHMPVSMFARLQQLDGTGGHKTLGKRDVGGSLRNRRVDK